MKRPQVAFAMQSNELRERLIDAAAMQQLTAVADIVQLDVLTDFDSEQSKEILAHTTALITGWGHRCWMPARSMPRRPCN
ncbi:hypothetical protein ACT3TS_18395 [Specibacter sp. AOP5-B1-6]